MATSPRPPLNDPPMNGLQFSHAWARFFQSATDTIANNAAFVAAVAALADGPSYANDTAAAAGGVPRGTLYRNGSQVFIRVT